MNFGRVTQNEICNYLEFNFDEIRYEKNTLTILCILLHIKQFAP